MADKLIFGDAQGKLIARAEARREGQIKRAVQRIQDAAKVQGWRYTADSIALRCRCGRYPWEHEPADWQCSTVKLWLIIIDSDEEIRREAARRVLGLAPTEEKGTNDAA